MLIYSYMVDLEAIWYWKELPKNNTTSMATKFSYMKKKKQPKKKELASIGIKIN